MIFADSAYWFVHLRAPNKDNYDENALLYSSPACGYHDHGSIRRQQPASNSHSTSVACCIDLLFKRYRCTDFTGTFLQTSGPNMANVWGNQLVQVDRWFNGSVRCYGNPRIGSSYRSRKYVCADHRRSIDYRSHY